MRQQTLAHAFAAAATLLLFANLTPIAKANSGSRRNVLLIMVDDLRPMLGCYGASEIKTPNIDDLARRAVVFERAYCQYAKCGASRLSMMTGLRPDAIGVHGHNVREVNTFRRRRPDATSIAAWLKRHGYETRSFGKIDHDGWALATDWSVAPAPGRPREMWETVDPAAPTKSTIIADRFDCPLMQSPDVPDEHLFAGRMTQEVTRLLRERDDERPFFFAVGFRRPHLPFVAPKKYFDLYQPDDTWLPPNPNPPQDSPIMAWFNGDGYAGAAKRFGLTMPLPPNRDQAMRFNGYELRSYIGAPKQGIISPSTQLNIRQAYAACVSFVDAQVGKLLMELRASRQWKNTVVILCSDHGWHLGEHSAWSKMTNFEIATRVPLLIAAPGIQPGRTRSLSELVDLYPTICELTGLTPPDHLQGESLLATLQNPAQPGEPFALSQYARFGHRYVGRAMRTDRFRYVQWTDTKNNRIVHRELYDHQNDANETRNVVNLSEHAGQVANLGRLLNEAFLTSNLPTKPK